MLGFYFDFLASGSRPGSPAVCVFVALRIRGSDGLDDDFHLQMHTYRRDTYVGCRDRNVDIWNHIRRQLIALEQSLRGGIKRRTGSNLLGEIEVTARTSYPVGSAGLGTTALEGVIEIL